MRKLTEFLYFIYLFIWLEGCFQVPGSIQFHSLYSVAGEETFGHQPVRTGPDDHVSEALIQ